jgi:hypothetical protein
VGDPAPAWSAARAVVGVGLIRDQHVRLLPRPARPTIVYPDAVQQRKQVRIVAGLTGGQQDRQRPAPTVDSEVDLRCQSAPRAAQRLTVTRRYRDAGGGSPFLWAPAACWWARTTLESTLMIHSTGWPSSRTWAFARIRSQVPPPVQRRSRSWQDTA